MQTSIDTTNAVIKAIEARLQARGKSIRMSLFDTDRAIILNCLHLVANGCDGAKRRDDNGFCRDDLRKNVHGLIEWLRKDNRLTFNGYEWALHMCVYYQRQWLPYMPADTLGRIKAMQASLPLFWDNAKK